MSLEDDMKLIEAIPEPAQGGDSIEDAMKIIEETPDVTPEEAMRLIAETPEETATPPPFSPVARPTDEPKSPLEREEKRRAVLLSSIENNERIEREVSRMQKEGVRGDVLTKYMQDEKYIEPSELRGYEEAWLHRLGKGETFSSVDEQRALDAFDKEDSHFSIDKAVTSVLGDLGESWKENKLPSPSKWTAHDTGVRERVKNELRVPLRDPNTGAINFEAVQKSDMSRAEQNELVLEYAYQKTGIPKEAFRDILNRRFGVSEKDGLPTASIKRAVSLVDAMAFNIPSRLYARGGLPFSGTKESPVGRVQGVKKTLPKIPVSIEKRDGRVYTNDGLLVEDAKPTDSEEVLKEKAWSAIIDNSIGTVEQQAQENWTQLGDVALSATGVGLVGMGAKGVARGAAKAAAKAPIAKIVPKTVELAARAVAKAATLAEQPLGHAGETAAKVMRFGPAIKRAEMEGSTALRIARKADSIVSPIATTAIGSYLGAPEGREAQQAIAGGGLSASMRLGKALATEIPLKPKVNSEGRLGMVPLIHVAEPDNIFSLIAREKKAFKEIARTSDETKLSSYSKNLFKRASAATDGPFASPGMTYKEFQEKLPIMVEQHKKMANAVLAWQGGKVNDAAIMAYFDGLAADKNFQAMADSLSQKFDPLYPISIVGKYREKLLREIEANSEKMVVDKAVDAKNSGTANDIKHAATIKELHKNLKKGLDDIPIEILNGSSADFIDYIRSQAGGSGKANLKYYADEIDNILQQESPTKPYRDFAIDMAKLYSATADAGNPLQFRDMLQYIGNLPEVASIIADNINLANKGSKVNPLDVTQRLDAISPRATAANLVKDPEAMRSIVRLAQEEVGVLYGAGKTLQDEKVGLKRAKEDLEQRRKDYAAKMKEEQVKYSMEIPYVLNAKKGYEESLKRREEKFTKDYNVGRKTHYSIEKKLDNKAMMATGMERQQIKKIASTIKTRRYTDSEIAKMPESVRGIVSDAEKLKTEINVLKRRIMMAEAKHAELSSANAQTRLSNLKKDFIKNSLLSTLTPEAQQAVVAIKSLFSTASTSQVLKDSNFFNNALASIAEDIENSITNRKVNPDGTLAPVEIIIDDTKLGLLFLLANKKNHDKLLLNKGHVGVGLSKQESAKFAVEVRNVCNTLFSISTEAKKWMENTQYLAEAWQKAGDNVTEITKQIALMKDIFNTVKRGKELQKFGFEVYALADKIENQNPKTKERINSQDLKLLVWLAQSSMAERMMITNERAAIPWAVTRVDEANRILKALQETLPEQHAIGVDLLSRTLDVDKDSMEAAAISAYYINPNNAYDGAGTFKWALAMSDMWREAEAGFWGQQGEAVRKLLNEETLATFMSRDTATAVGVHVNANRQAQQRSKVLSQRLAQGYASELEGLVSNGKSYSYYQLRPAFVSIVKRVCGGVSGFTESHYLMLDSKITPSGAAVKAWAESGFDNNVLRSTLANNSPEWLAKNDVDKVYNDILAYLPNPHSTIEGKLLDVTPSDYDMALKFISTHQKWDRKKLDERNRLNDLENKRLGKNYNSIQYYPYRIDSGSQILTALTTDLQAIDNVENRAMLFGRVLGSSVSGQVLKANSIPSEFAIRHPQENFVIDANSLFQSVLTRESQNALQDIAGIMRSAGNTNQYRAIVSSFLGADLENAANRTGDWGELLGGAMNSAPVIKHLRLLGSALEPMTKLIRVPAAFLENTAQSFTMGITTSPRTLAAESKALLETVPYTIKYALLRLKAAGAGGLDAIKGNPKLYRDAQVVSRFFAPLSPEYNIQVADIAMGMNPPRNSKAEQQMKRVRWEVGAKTKAADKYVGDPVNAFFAAYADVTKEAWEFTQVEIRAQHAASIWRNVTEDCIALKQNGGGRPELVALAYKTLVKDFEGALGSNAAAMHFAQSAADSVLAGNPLKGFKDFGVNYVTTQLGRYDPHNLPSFIKTMGRWIPGTRQFYNPATNGMYRVLQAAHAFSGQRGANATRLSTAVISLLATVGAVGAFSAAASYWGIPWFAKMANISVPQGMPADAEDAGKKAMSYLVDPFSPRGGSKPAMAASIWGKVLGSTWGLVMGGLNKQQDGTFDQGAWDKRQRALWTDLLTQIYNALPSAPIAALTNIIIDVPAWGMSHYGSKEDLNNVLRDATESGLFDPDQPDKLAPGATGFVADFVRYLAGISDILPLNQLDTMTEEQNRAVNVLQYSTFGKTLSNMAKKAKAESAPDHTGEATAEQFVAPQKP